MSNPHKTAYSFTSLSGLCLNVIIITSLVDFSIFIGIVILQWTQTDSRGSYCCTHVTENCAGVWVQSMILLRPCSMCLCWRGGAAWKSHSQCDGYGGSSALMLLCHTSLNPMQPLQHKINYWLIRSSHSDGGVSSHQPVPTSTLAQDAVVNIFLYEAVYTKMTPLCNNGWQVRV